MAVTVVHVGRDICDVYIGRDFGGWAGSKYANPFPIDRNHDREEALTRYAGWLRREIQAGRITAQELSALDGKRLGCWCKPKPCHGDILAQFVEWAVKEVASNN